MPAPVKPPPLRPLAGLLWGVGVGALLLGALATLGENPLRGAAMGIVGLGCCIVARLTPG